MGNSDQDQDWLAAGHDAESPQQQGLPITQRRRLVRQRNRRWHPTYMISEPETHKVLAVIGRRRVELKTGSTTGSARLRRRGGHLRLVGPDDRVLVEARQQATDEYSVTIHGSESTFALRVDEGPSRRCGHLLAPSGEVGVVDLSYEHDVGDWQETYVGGKERQHAAWLNELCIEVAPDLPLPLLVVSVVLTLGPWANHAPREGRWTRHRGDTRMGPGGGPF